MTQGDAVRKAEDFARKAELPIGDLISAEFLPVETRCRNRSMAGLPTVGLVSEWVVAFTLKPSATTKASLGEDCDCLIIVEENTGRIYQQEQL